MTEVSRPVPVGRVGAHGVDYVVDARPDELPALAARLLIPAVARLHCSFRLDPAPGRAIAAVGVLEAEVTQVCVISLEEFSQTVRERFAIQFVPAGDETDDTDPESMDQVPYEGNSIDLGEAAVEQLALALDPYPHQPGAALPEGLDGEAHPFGALAALQRKQ